MSPILSQPYTLRRYDLALLAAWQYVRRAWWFLIATPIFGLLVLMTIDEPVLRYFAFVGILWPFTIPARGIVATMRPAKKLIQETRFELAEDLALFHFGNGKGLKMPLTAVRGSFRHMNYRVFELRRFQILPVPESAFSPEDLVLFNEALKEKGLG